MTTLSDQEKQDIIDHLKSTANPHDVDSDQSGSVQNAHKSPVLTALPSDSKPDPDEVEEGTIILVTDNQKIERSEKDSNGNWAWIEYPVGGSNNLDQEDVEDIVAQLVVEENLIGITYDDGNDELKFKVKESALMDEIKGNFDSDDAIDISKSGDIITFSIDGDKVDIDYDPSDYSPDDSISEADDKNDLSAHLKGIEDSLLSEEEVEDIISKALTEGDDISIKYDDANDEIIISTGKDHFTRVARVTEDSDHVFDFSSEVPGSAAIIRSAFSCSDSDDYDIDLHMEHDDGQNQYGDVVSQLGDSNEYDQQNEFEIDQSKDIQLRASVVGTIGGASGCCVGIGGMEEIESNGGKQRGEMYTEAFTSDKTLDLSEYQRKEAVIHSLVNIDKLEHELDCNDDGSADCTGTTLEPNGNFRQKEDIVFSQDVPIIASVHPDASGAIVTGEIK